MKLAPLLAGYLYAHKRLELPGLGIFLLDPQQDYSGDQRSGKVNQLEGISFEFKPSVKESPDLIQYIATEAKKLKALAAADLDSHLELVQQFLNIGKPFMCEGIGTLVKHRSGEISFTPGEPIPEVIAEKIPKESQGDSKADEHKGYKEIFYGGKMKTPMKKLSVVGLLVAGLALAIWGGYTVYKRSNKKESATASIQEPVKNDNNLPTPESDHVSLVKPDTVVKIAPVPLTAGQLKFVLETAMAKRAFERYQRLKSYQWSVQMETNDSMMYKLYVMMPANFSDTTRILDSLTRMNGKRVYIE